MIITGNIYKFVSSYLIMNNILVIIDGLGDLPCKELKGKTPLESAKKPNLNYLTSKGKLGYMYPINETTAPESDTAIIAILGNNFFSSYRGYLESLGSGLKIDKGDLAFRTNFATIDNLTNKKVIDRRAGRTLTTKEANLLAKAINKKVKLPCKFIFKNTIQHRGVLVLKGGFSDNITNTDPAYHVKNKIILNDNFKFSMPLDDEENSKYTANVLNEFIEQSHRILENHPVNKKRAKKKLLKANILLTRDASNGIELNQFKDWNAIVYMPLEIGICKASGMKIFSFKYPKMKKNVYENLYEGLKKAIDFAIGVLKKNKKGNFYIHFKETDVPGHDGKAKEKKKMIELLDRKFFSFLRKFEKEKTKLIVTGDHSTPCSLKSHSSDALPVLFCDWKENSKREFNEKESRKGKLGKIYGKELLKLIS